jgi:hypothetical protein
VRVRPHASTTSSSRDDSASSTSRMT